MADWTSNLDDDQAATGRNAVAPLDALGIDPDDAATNRAAAMAQLHQNPMDRLRQAYQTAQAQSALPRTVLPPAQPAATSNSVRAAGAMGGAGAAPTPAGTGAIPNAPTAVTAPSVAPATPGKTLEDFGTTGLTGLEQGMHSALQSTAAEPTVDPEEQRLADQRAADIAAEPQAYDSQTGKRLAAYKPSVGQEILRGVEGFGLGLGEGGLKGAIVGSIKPGIVGLTDYGAPTAQYGRDLARSEQAVASDSQQLQAAQDRFKQLQDARRNQSADFRAAAGLGKDLTGGATGMENAQTDATAKPMQARADLLKAQNDTTGAKLQLSAGVFQQRGQQADRLGLKGTNRTLYILNGKVPDPRQATAEEIASGEAERIFRQKNGRGPQTLEEFQQIQQAARGAQDKATPGSSANDRALLRVTEAHLKSLQAQRSKAANGFADPGELKDLDAQIATAQTDYDNAKTSVDSAGEQNQPPPNNNRAMPNKPPTSLLQKTPELGIVQGKNGEAWMKQGGKWVPPE